MHQEKSLIFIDWDDTLFPTHWIQTSNIDMENPNEITIAMFQELDQHITDMITRMFIQGHVFIVTNGSSTWIDSCLKLLPNVKQIVDNNTVCITSARDLFEKEYDSCDWKKLTFKIFLNEHIPEVEGVYRIISFGDSMDEHNAVVELKHFKPVENQKRIIGSIKFIRRPSLNQLVSQIKIVQELHIDMVNFEEDYILDLQIFIG